jgi:hypothetical protein
VLSVHDLIVRSATSGLALRDRRTGAMPAGHNGPYHDPETPVRATAHWLILYLKAFELSGAPTFRTAAQEAARYLLADDHRPARATFWHRSSTTKDRCNGLIGQAWTIEALAIAAPKLEMEELATLAREVFDLHPFDDTTTLWTRVEIDGTILGIDQTFNHQLWFAAAASLLDHPPARERARRFLDRVPTHMTQTSSGVIAHPLASRGLRRTAWQWITRLRSPRHSLNNRRSLPLKAVGYHAFNLYALAMMRGVYPDHPLWRTALIDRALAYAQSPSFADALDRNPYGYPYNPPGLELPFVFESFARGTRSLQEAWLKRQLERCLDPETALMSRGTEDPATHSARLYEATRLPDLQLPPGIWQMTP